MITIELPWPDKRLSPNARVHWAVKARAVKDARQTGYWVAFAESTVPAYPGIGTKFRSQYTFCPPDKRRRDTDNFVASMKSYQDGVCDWLCLDDSCFEMEKPEWGEVVKGGKVVLRLEEME